MYIRKYKLILYNTILNINIFLFLKNLLLLNQFAVPRCTSVCFSPEKLLFLGEEDVKGVLSACFPSGLL